MKTWKLVALVGVLIFSVLLALFGVSVDNPNSSHAGGIISINIGDWRVITIGPPTAEASGTFDYTCDGVADNVQFQAALNALPSTGGKIIAVVPTGGTYNFTANVTRAISNVVIEGCGQGTYFAYNGVDPIFTAGGTGWVFRDLRTDAGGISGDCTKQNITEGATFVDFDLNGVKFTPETYCGYDSIKIDGTDGLDFHIFRDARVNIWDSTTFSGTPPMNPADADQFAFAVYGDLLYGDHITWTESAPGVFSGLHIGKRVGNNIIDDYSTVIYSHKDEATDASGGAFIELKPDYSAGVVNSGMILLEAYGRGTGGLANSIVFATRSGVNTAANRWLIASSGDFIPIADSTYDVGSVANRVDTIYADILSGFSLPNSTDMRAKNVAGTEKSVVYIDGSDVMHFNNDGLDAFYLGSESVSPGSPAANGWVLWAQDNGTGKTQLMVTFATGEAQQVAIQP